MDRLFKIAVGMLIVSLICLSATSGAAKQARTESAQPAAVASSPVAGDSTPTTAVDVSTVD